jgi:beta-glucosidase-like glycosyl hydrolase
VYLLEAETGKVRLARKFASFIFWLLISVIGFSPDPVLTGVAMGETIKGIQDAGVIACAKHFIMNEQEHNREPSAPTKFAYSSNLDDQTMHELYLWLVDSRCM